MGLQRRGDIADTDSSGPSPAERPGTIRLLREAARMVRAAGAPLLGLILVSQLLVSAVAFPVLGWLFREALRAGGMTGLDLFDFAPDRTITLTVALILLICLLAFWLTSLQFTLLVVMLREARSGMRPSLRSIAVECGRVGRKLLRPSALPMYLYLFAVLPLSGFGFASAFARGVAIPPSMSAELVKTDTGSAILTAFGLIMIVLGLRFAAGVPLFVMSDATGGQALRASWRLTRGLGTLPLVGAVLVVLIATALATTALLIAALVPTALSDELAPAASPVVAAYSLGAAQTVGILLTGVATATISAILIAFVEARRGLLPASVRMHEASPAGAEAERIAAGGPADSRRSRRRSRVLVTATAILVALGLGTAGIGIMRALSAHPDTLVLAHRGFSAGGVENTIGGLEAAAAAGADLVEMDVMQTRDGEFVAMHDADLSRLAGIDAQVRDLTLAELTAITVHDSYGNEGPIPSFEDYAIRAAELDMPLLIEIKLGGADTPDHVDRLVTVLERLGLLEQNIYHSLDPASVARLKQLRPDLTVGYTMPFAAAAAPETPADFIVVEVWGATPAVQQSAADRGLGFMAWTVNEAAAQHEHLRRGTDGIITDHPDAALAAREDMREETGLADTLIDALQRFVVVL